MSYDERHEVADDLGHHSLYRDVDWDSATDVPEPDWSREDEDLEVPSFPKADDVMLDGDILEGV